MTSLERLYQLQHMEGWLAFAALCTLLVAIVSVMDWLHERKSRRIERAYWKKIQQTASRKENS